MAFSVRVLPGDTLTSLARRFGVSVESLAHRNRLTDPNRIRVGQQLEVPGDELVVQKGDTLGALAWRAKTSVEKLARSNALKDPNRLQVGQRLRLDTFESPGRAPTGRAEPVEAALRAPPLGRAEPVEAPLRAPPPRRAEPVEAPFRAPPPGRAEPVEAPLRAPPPGRVEPVEAALRSPLKLTQAQQLRVASAVVSTGENLMRLRGAPLVVASRSLGASGAAIAAARMVGDARALRADVSAGGVSANSIESGSKLARNAVRVVRGLEQVVVSVVPKLAAHTVPGLSVASAALDTAVAAALESNPEATEAERDLARAAAVTSWVSALNIPIVSQVSGIAATGFGLWRDAYSDERRERLPPTV